MTQFVSDSFTGSDSTELSAYDANWVAHSASGGRTASIKSNQANSDSFGETVYYRSESPASADYYVASDVYVNANSAPATSGSAAVLGRVDSGANTWYLLQLDDSANEYSLYKRVSGSWTQLGSSVGVTPTVGVTYQIKLEMIGTAIKAYLAGSGSASISVTDSSISSAGKAGFRFDAAANTVRLDNFDATDTSSGGGSATAWYYRAMEAAAA